MAPKEGKTKTVPVVSKTLELTPAPEFLAHRIAVFDKLKAIKDKEVAAKARDSINVTLPDGRNVPATAWETTPADIAKSISKSLLERTVVAKVNGALWDISRPFEGPSSLEFLDFNNDEAKRVYWHSSAHILGEAAERRFGCHLCIGPPTDEGFFYEFGMPEQQQSVTEEDKKAMATIMDSVLKEKQPFQRLVMTKEELLEMFKYNPFKQQIIQSKIPDGTSSSVYRCGPLIDLCLGPHVVDTGRVKSFSLLKV
jgi:threonyl-tRNA synthetase